jgi:hypothetical protein
MASTKETETANPTTLAPATPDPMVAFDSKNVITLLLGKASSSQSTMTVHKSFIIRDSEFFATALKSTWVEGQTRVIKLPEEQPAHVTYYLDWIYNRRFPTAACDTILIGQTFSKLATYHDSLAVLSKLYVLGKRFLDKTFQIALLDKIIRVMNIDAFPSFGPNSMPTLAIVNVIYNGTTSTSPARRPLVDWYLAKAHHAEFLKPFSMFYEKEFLADLVTAFTDKTQPKLPSSGFQGILLRSGTYAL